MLFFTQVRLILLATIVMGASQVLAKETEGTTSVQAHKTTAAPAHANGAASAVERKHRHPHHPTHHYGPKHAKAETHEHSSSHAHTHASAHAHAVAPAAHAAETAPKVAAREDSFEALEARRGGGGGGRAAAGAVGSALGGFAGSFAQRDLEDVVELEARRRRPKLKQYPWLKTIPRSRRDLEDMVDLEARRRGRGRAAAGAVGSALGGFAGSFAQRDLEDVFELDARGCIKVPRFPLGKKLKIPKRFQRCISDKW